MWSRRSELGLGHRKWLQPATPFPSRPPHACQLGSLPICCVGFQSQSCPLSGGARGLSQGGKAIRRGAPSDQPLHSFLLTRATRYVGQVVHSVRAPGSIRQATCPGTGLCHPAGAFFATHTRPLNRLLVLAPVSLLLICFKQNFAECGPLTLRHSWLQLTYRINNNNNNNNCSNHISWPATVPRLC